MPKDEYWYKVVVDRVLGPMGFTARIDYVAASVVRETEHSVILSSQALPIIKEDNTGPWYPTKKEAARAQLAESLKELVAAESACERLKDEYRVVLQHC